MEYRKALLENRPKTLCFLPPLKYYLNRQTVPSLFQLKYYLNRLKDSALPLLKYYLNL